MYLRNSKEKLINKGKANIILVYFYLTCIDQLRNENNIFTEKKKHFGLQKKTTSAYKTQHFLGLFGIDQ